MVIAALGPAQRELIDRLIWRQVVPLLEANSVVALERFSMIEATDLQFDLHLFRPNIAKKAGLMLLSRRSNVACQPACP
jgi:hypothetical protein